MIHVDRSEGVSRRLPKTLLLIGLALLAAGQNAPAPASTEPAAWHAAERARLARAGTPAPFFDGKIAAIAAVNGLTLVTADVMDFEVFTGIEVVDWRRPAR